MREIVWGGDSRDRLRKFPPGARNEAGRQLLTVQFGGEPDDWKPMPSVGVGVREIRIWEQAGTFRVIYLAKLADKVAVLHAFKKTTQATSRKDIELARKRLRELKGE